MFRANNRPPGDKVRVLVADSTTMDCQLLSQAIQRHNHLRVTAQATSSAETISAVRETQPDVAVISARLQDGAFAGLLALRGLRGLQTRSRIVFLLDKDEPELIVNAFLNNARGVFGRMGSSGELCKCIQSVSEGQIWVNNSQLEYIVEALMQAPAHTVTSGRGNTVLSKREEEIAQLVAAGLSNLDVSNKLGLSQHTVKNNLSRIFEKLGISTRIELVLYILSQPKVPQPENSSGFQSPCEFSA
jgi:two-component system nitrate/nitrite response regulator NarL